MHRNNHHESTDLYSNGGASAYADSDGWRDSIAGNEFNYNGNGSTPNGDDVGARLSFKEKKTFHQRMAESRNIKARFPAKVPVIVERHGKEKHLPPLDKSKYLVPQELNMSQFVLILRDRMHLDHSQALYLLVNDKHVVSMSANIAQLYQEHRDEDGFLYLTYASQEMFG